MTNKEYIIFQVKQFSELKKDFNHEVISSGEKHTIFELVTAYLEDAIRENSTLQPLFNTEQVFEEYSLNHKSFFEETFGRSSASAIYQMENFENSMSVFFRVYTYILFNDPRYSAFLQKALKDISLFSYKDEEVPVLASLPQNDKPSFSLAVPGLKKPMSLYYNWIKFFESQDRLSLFSEGSKFFVDRMKLFAMFPGINVQIFAPFNPADIYQYDWFETPESNYSSITAIIESAAFATRTGEDLQISRIDDEAVIEQYSQAQKQLYTDYELLAANEYEKAKVSAKNISGQDLFSELYKQRNALNIRIRKEGSYDIANIIPFDYVVAIDSMQATQVVVDARCLILAVGTLQKINPLEYLHFHVDEAEEYLYITTDYSVERDETSIVKSDEFGEGRFNKKVRRALFARVKIKKQNYAKAFSYLWLYKFNKDATIQEILSASTDEDLSSISIPSDFLNQQSIINARQKDYILRQEDNLQRSVKTGDEFYEDVVAAAESYIKTYATATVDAQGTVYYEPRQDNVGMQYTNSIQNKDYVWKVNEVFWRNNKNITIPEMIAFFISKGDSYNYRLLSYRILGIDVYLFKDKLINPLLLKGLLFITEFSIDKDLKKVVTPMKLAYKYEYITGGYYKKSVDLREEYKNKPDKLRELDERSVKDVYGSIKIYFGDADGSVILNNHINWLSANRPIKMSLNGSSELGNLLTPTIYDPKIFNLTTEGNTDPILQGIFESFVNKDKAEDWRSFKAQNENAVSMDDFIELYLKRNTISKYITKHLKTNVMYELSALEENGEIYYTLIGKGNGKVLFKSKNSNKVEDYGLSNLNGGVPVFLDIPQYSYKKKSVSTTGTIKATIRPNAFSQPGYTNNRFLSHLELAGRLKHINYFVPFEKSTYEALHKTGFISDATWSRIKDKEVLVTAQDMNDELERRGLEPTNSNFRELSKEYLMVLSEKESRIIYQIFFKVFVSKREDATKEGDIQFAKHIKLNNTWIDVYEDAWNRVYNDQMHPTKEISTMVNDNGVLKEKRALVLDNSKFPVFLEYSRYFGYDSNEEFMLNDSQIDGVKFSVASGNSGLLAHEVGFGKTLAAISTMYHCIITGEAKRPFISAPVQVYRNFIKEISGEPGVFRGFAPQLPVLRLFNAKPQVFLTYDNKTLEQKSGIKRYNKNQIKLIQDFAKLKKIKTGIISAKYNNSISFVDTDDNSYKKFLKDFEVFLDSSAPSWREEPSFSEITFNRFESIYNILLKEYYEEIKQIVDKAKSRESELYKNPDRVKEYKDLLKVESTAYKRGTGIYRGKTQADKDFLFESRKSDQLVLDALDKINENVTTEKANVNAEKASMLASYIRHLITMIPIKVYDAFGWYEPVFLQDGAIVISSHTALAQFEIENEQAVEANMQVGIEKIAAFKLAIRPVSFRKLRCDMIVVDEVHNFNEYFSKSDRVVIDRYSSKSGGYRAIISYRPGTGSSDEYNKKSVLRYETAGIKTKETKIVVRKLFELVARDNFNKNGKYNTIALSATPFVDNLYQMISVFGMLRPTMSVAEFYSSFCYETWGLSMNNKNEIVYVPEISSFKNSIARNNYMKSFCQFYTYDANIERRRPNKFTFPYISAQDKNNSLYTCYTDTSSTVPLSDVQVKLFENISKFLYGEIKESEIAPLREPEKISVKKLAEEIELLQLWAESLNNGVADVPDVEDWMIKNDILNLDPSEGGASELKALKEALEEAATKIKDDETGGAYIVFYKKKAKGEDEEDESDEAVVDSAIGDAMTDKSSKLKYTSLVQQRVALSPYMVLSKENNKMECSLLPSLKGNAKEVFHESAKIFVENSPKVLFAIMACMKTIRYHQDRNEDISGQVLFMSKTQNFTYGGVSYNAFDLIKSYLESFYGLNKTFTIEVADDDSDDAKTVAITVSEVEKLTGDVTSSPLKKKAIEKAFNQGLIKILLGSEAIREGLNLQGMNTATVKHGTSSIYILTPDYAPMVFMQLEGRVWRQGNPLDNVRIVYVLHKNSIDQHVYSRLKIKIAQVKALLEAGIYEAGGTQFTQDIKGVSEYLTTNIDKKVDNRWDEEKQRLQAEITTRNNIIDKVNIVAKTYGYAKNFVDSCSGYINEMTSFLKMCGIVSAYIKYSKYGKYDKSSKSAEVILGPLFNQMKELKDKFDKEKDEKYLNPMRAAYDAYVEDYKKRKALYNEEQAVIKEQAKQARRLREKQAMEAKKSAQSAGVEKPLTEIMGEQPVTASAEEEIKIVPFAEQELNWTDFRSQNNSQYIEVLKDINARKTEEMARTFTEGCEAISNALIGNKQLAKELNIINAVKLDSNSRVEDIIEAAAALKDNSYHYNIDFPDDYLVKVDVREDTAKWGYNTYRYKYFPSLNIFAATDLGGLASSDEKKRASASPTYSFIYDCIEKENILQKSPVIRLAEYVDLYAIKVITDLAGFGKLFTQEKYYYDGVNRKETYYSHYPSVRLRNIMQLLSYGMAPMDTLALYETLIESKGLTIKDTDVLIKNIQKEKDRFLKDILNEREYRMRFRKEYEERKKKEDEERKGLSDMFQVVDYESKKFSNSNKMIYFRSIENLQEVRNSLYQC